MIISNLSIMISFALSVKDFVPQTANAEKFIARMKKASHLWGGDFSRVDTPHFDKQLDANSFSYNAKFNLNQNQIASGAPIELQTISD